MGQLLETSSYYGVLYVGFLCFSSGDVEDGLSSTSLVVHTLYFDVPDCIRAVEFSPSGNYLVACSEGKRIKLWTAPDWMTTIERYGR